MIIWTGLGILIPLVAIFGVVAGTFILSAFGFPGAGPGIGLGLAALGNWGLWKLIYPKQPKILVDPATGQQVVIKPNHGLFFIPAKAWTWILAALAVPAIFMGGIGERETGKKAAMPGFKEFKAADDLIDAKSKGQIYGNSETAKAVAGEFSTTMKTMTEAMFSGGSKKNFMTGGNFLTYCHEGSDTIVFLSHVPSLRSYKSDEAKDGLNKLAWTVARQAASKLDPDRKKTLLIGLRGVASYGSIQQGKTADEQPGTPSDFRDTSVFFPTFAARTP